MALPLSRTIPIGLGVVTGLAEALQVGCLVAATHPYRDYMVNEDCHPAAAAPRKVLQMLVPDRSPLRVVAALIGWRPEVRPTIAVDRARPTVRATRLMTGTGGSVRHCYRAVTSIRPTVTDCHRPPSMLASTRTQSTARWISLAAAGAPNNRTATEVPRAASRMSQRWRMRARRVMVTASTVLSSPSPCRRGSRRRSAQPAHRARPPRRT